jgi:CopG family nickel-responsive transcriptional regulator
MIVLSGVPDAGIRRGGCKVAIQAADVTLVLSSVTLTCGVTQLENRVRDIQPVMRSQKVARFSVSLPPNLLRQLDQMVREKGYHNRSLAITDMVRDNLVDHHQKFAGREIAGTITLVYDHHKQHVQAALTDIQHDHHEVIVSTLHVHLDHHNCLEVLVVRGKSSLVKRIAEELIAAKGVKHGKLTVTTTGKDLPA